MTTPATEAARLRLRAELDEVLGTAPPVRAGGDPRPVYRLLGERSLLAPHWPVGYGGRGGGPRDAALVVDALVRAGVPDTLFMLSVQIVGTFLLTAGSDEQRRRLLPELASGRRLATVLYSEPDAGADHAALRTAAVPRPGGGWSLTGRKVYSVGASVADEALVLARTSVEAAKYQGLTLFLVPLAAPGVEIGAFPALTDEPLSDVLLDRVPVGPGAVVGPVGGAWPLVTDALAVERTGVEYVARAAHWLDTAVLDLPADPDDALAEAVGRLGGAVMASRLLSEAVLDGLADGRPDPVLAAGAKWYASEAAGRVARWAAEHAGLASCLGAGDPGAVRGGLWQAAYREAPGLTISAGTSEMLLQTVGAALLSGDTADPDGPAGAAGAADSAGPRSSVSPGSSVGPGSSASPRSSAGPGNSADPGSSAGVAGSGGPSGPGGEG